MKNYLIILCFLLFSLNLMAKSSSLKVDIELSPAGSFAITTKRIKGSVRTKGDQLVASKISTPVKSFETGIDLRDKHVKEKLKYDKFPYITVTEAVGQNGAGTALLKVMKVEKKINFKYEKIGKTIKVSFDLSLADFEIRNISYMDIGVADKAKITAILPLKE